MNIRAAVAILVVSSGIARADPRWIEGTYRNPALGYAVKVPRGSELGMQSTSAWISRRIGSA
jgi:hypothetical protein